MQPHDFGSLITPADQSIKFVLGERAILFFLDPSGNTVEFKAFANMASLFTKSARLVLTSPA
jgi:extradiol dioxygenase family protein